MEIQVRIATATDRAALEQFYSREGLDFHSLSTGNSIVPARTSRETMYVIAATTNMIVAALKFDVANDPNLGNIGYIQHFEIEDDLEHTDIGLQMLDRAIEIADDKNLSALDAVVSEKRADVIKLYLDSEFRELRKEIYLRRNFRPSPF